MVSGAQKQDKLVFKKAIVPSVQKNIPTKELLNRLQALSDELSAVDQDNVDAESYRTIAADLVNKKLLKNSNVGVQSYVCCCLSDVLRIYAPDAPFTAGELSSIFNTFFQQLRFLVDQENPYFLQQNYLLKRLAEVKSIILITDLPDSEELIRRLFHMFYDLSTKNFPTRLEPLVSDMLAEVIGECESVPMDVLKLILSTFLSSSSASYSLVAAANSNISNPGFNFSLHICEVNVHKMSRHVTQYFSELLNATSKPDDAQQNNHDGVTFNSDKAFKTLEKIHKLSIQIWRCVPELLGSVMGLINDELNTDNEQVRILATGTIGSMIASSSSDTDNTAGFVMAHRTTWLNWLGKTMDISASVRAKWVEQLPEIINSATIATSGISTELRNGLTKCLLDSSDKVRFIACRTLDKLEFEIFSSAICSKVVMNALFQLIREKNPDIRKKSIKILSEVYDNYHKSKASNVVINFGNHNEEEVAEIESLISEGIPNHILALNYINDKDITMNVDITLFEKLLPFEVNSIKRVDRLAHFYSCLNEKSKASFIAICKRQQKQSEALQHYVTLSEEYSKLSSSHDATGDEESMDKDQSKSSESIASQSPSTRKAQIVNKLEKIITWLSVSYPAGLNTNSCLDRLMKLKNYRFFNLIKFCISPESDYKTIKNSIKELLVKLSDAKYIRLENEKVQVTTADMVSSFKILLYRASPILFNKANIAELINYSKDVKHEWYSVSNDLLESISTIVPDVFKFHVKNLTDLIHEDYDIELDNATFSPKTNNLRTIYHFIKKFPEYYPKATEFSESLKGIAINGKPREARYAVKILGLSSRKEFHASEIANAILPLDKGAEQLTTHLASIAELYLIDPLSVEDHTDSIHALLIESILRSNCFDASETVDLNDDSWIDDVNLDIDHKKYKVLYQKILGVRIIVNRLRALASESDLNKSFQTDEALSAAAAKPLKLLTMIITSGGELIKQNSDSTQTPKYIRQKLRIHAGFSILKLAKYPRFQRLIDHQVINKLAVLLHDECVNIRVEFSKKLEVCLWNGELSENFLHLIFLMALEPKESLKEQITTWIYSSHKRCIESKDIKFERILVRLVHCIAHNDTFKRFLNNESESLDKRLTHAYTYAAEFIIFYLQTIAKQDNISLLYYFASRVKQYRDATVDQSLYHQDEFPQPVLNTYRIAELAQLAIQVLNGTKHWNMQTWPGKIKLHADLYAPMETYEEAQKIISTVYIKDDLQAALRVLIKRRLNHSTKRKTTSKENGNSKRVKSENQNGKTNLAVKPKQKNGMKPKIKRTKKKISSDSLEPSRKSSRSTNKVSYVEASGSDGEGQESEYSD